MITRFFRFFVGELYILSTTYTDNEARDGAIYQLFDPERFVFNLFWTIFETDEEMAYFCNLILRSDVKSSTLNLKCI